jgi:hypothetical protein
MIEPPPPLSGPPPAHLHPRVVPWQHALAWYEDAMRLFRRAPATWAALALITIASELVLRLVPSLGPLLPEAGRAARCVRAGLRGGVRGSRREARDRRRDEGVPGAGRRDRSDHRFCAHHVRRRIARRVVGCRCEPARPRRGNR